MAELIPSLEKINNMKPKPTEGEYTLIKKLSEELGDDYKVYYQPFLNGDRPDVIVLKKNLGILIIEVKDWNLDCYSIGKEVVGYDNSIGFDGKINENRKRIIFRLKENNAIVGNPFDQVTRYKDDFYGPYIEELFMEKVNNKKIFGNLVKTAVYFHKENKESVNKRFGEFIDSYKSVPKYEKHIYSNVFFTKIWGYDSDIISDIERDYYYRKAKKDEKFMDIAEKNNKEFERILQPPFHDIDEGKYIKFVRKQEVLANSKANEQKKIKGVAGSGKTLLLAHRAVSAAKRTKNTVLILTYNITICNYIEDRISKVRENFRRDNFEINNYHFFLKRQLENLGYTSVSLFSRESEEDNKKIEKEISEILKNNRDDLRKYDAIFIDECQDFDKNWLDIIKDNFLAPNGEFVIFADEKQNIYGRDLDKDKKVKTNIVGKWNELNQSFRVKNKISKLAELYQTEFMHDKYELDKFESEQIGFGDNSGEILYRYGKNISNQEIEETVMKIIREKNIHDNTVCILGMKVENLRPLEKYFREKNAVLVPKKDGSGLEKVYQKTFEIDIETEEEFDEIKEDAKKNGLDFQAELEKRRRIRKRHFYLDSGKVKISTTHSFKGWELENIVLIIDSDDGNTTDELIYTAFTRAKENLIIFNRGNRKIDKFFNEKVDYTPI